jgi:hypothetical protein
MNGPVERSQPRRWEVDASTLGNHTHENISAMLKECKSEIGDVIMGDR